jgi:hypothetical protein
MYIHGDLSLSLPVPLQSPIQLAVQFPPLGHGPTYLGLTSDESPKTETRLRADPINTRSPKPALARTRRWGGCLTRFAWDRAEAEESACPPRHLTREVKAAGGGGRVPASGFPWLPAGSRARSTRRRPFAG